MLQITDLAQEQKIPPILRLGFRPFFLLSGIFAAFSIALWLLIYNGEVTMSVLGGGYWWHLHEMLFGFCGAVIAGFLLTAVQNWTGMRGIQGKQLALLVIIWLTGRLALLFPEVLGNNASVIIDILFFPLVALFLAKPIVAIKQYRNLFFVPLLLLFTVINIQMHLSLIMPDVISMKYSGYAGVIAICFLISVMAGRVTPMFTANGTKTTKALPVPWLDKLTNGSLALIALSLLLEPMIGFNDKAFGALTVFAGVCQFIRLMRWKPWITLSVPLLWSLHSGIKLLAVGLVILGISYLVGDLPHNHLWHLLTIGGIATIILAMIARVSLGHTGRPLTPPKAMTLAFIILPVITLVRSFGPLVWPESSLLFVEISAIGWIIAFLLFVFTYAPMLLKARLDGRPG